MLNETQPDANVSSKLMWPKLYKKSSTDVEKIKNKKQNMLLEVLQ